MTRVKVCGLTTETDRDVAIDAGADAVGFVVDVPVETDRELSSQRAAELMAAVPPFVTSVLVTMPDTYGRAKELLDQTNPDAVQLHNDLPIDVVEDIAAATSANVIKAIDADQKAAERYAAVVDALLVDSREASGAGGTGRRSDWDQAAAIRETLDCPVVLAGGLTPANVGAAVSAVEPFAVDVSSGVERSEGRKDAEAVRAFVEAVHPRPVTP